MPRQNPSSEPIALNRVALTAKEAAKTSSSVGPLPHMSMKHDLSHPTDEATASDRFNKRRKINANTGLHHHSPPSSHFPSTTMIENPPTPEPAPDTSIQELSSHVRHLSTKYNFTTMSILSSAKINDKVKKLLSRVENFSFADPKSKPGIVVLHAKSGVASKMVSIVEIARQEIERDKGKWWQYSTLEGRIAEMKVRSVKHGDDGKPLTKLQGNRAGDEPQELVDSSGKEVGCALDEVALNHEVVNEDEEMEDAFETMANSKVADQRVNQSRHDSGRNIRATPVMIIYFARVPVPGLRQLYGFVPLYSSVTPY